MWHAALKLDASTALSQVSDTILARHSNEMCDLASQYEHDSYRITDREQHPLKQQVWSI